MSGPADDECEDDTVSVSIYHRLMTLAISNIKVNLSSMTFTKSAISTTFF